MGRKNEQSRIGGSCSCLALIAFFSGVSVASFVAARTYKPDTTGVSGMVEIPRPGVPEATRPHRWRQCQCTGLGFPNNDTKLAYEDGTLVAPSVFRQDPMQRQGSHCRVSTAFDALKTAATSGPPATAPLVVTSVGLGTGVFATDRGRRTLPAWLFSFQGVENPAQVLAVSPRRSSRHRNASSFSLRCWRVPLRSGAQPWPGTIGRSLSGSPGHPRGPGPVRPPTR